MGPHGEHRASGTSAMIAARAVQASARLRPSVLLLHDSATPAWCYALLHARLSVKFRVVSADMDWEHRWCAHAVCDVAARGCSQQQWRPRPHTRCLLPSTRVLLVTYGSFLPLLACAWCSVEEAADSVARALRSMKPVRASCKAPLGCYRTRNSRLTHVLCARPCLTRLLAPHTARFSRTPLPHRRSRQLSGGVVPRLPAARLELCADPLRAAGTCCKVDRCACLVAGPCMPSKLTPTARAVTAGRLLPS